MSAPAYMSINIEGFTTFLQKLKFDLTWYPGPISTPTDLFLLGKLWLQGTFLDFTLTQIQFFHFCFLFLKLLPH